MDTWKRRSPANAAPTTNSACTTATLARSSASSPSFKLATFTFKISSPAAPSPYSWIAKRSYNPRSDPPPTSISLAPAWFPASVPLPNTTTMSAHSAAPSRNRLTSNSQTSPPHSPPPSISLPRKPPSNPRSTSTTWRTASAPCTDLSLNAVTSSPAASPERPTSPSATSSATPWTTTWLSAKSPPDPPQDSHSPLPPKPRPPFTPTNSPNFLSSTSRVSPSPPDPAVSTPPPISSPAPDATTPSPPSNPSLMHSFRSSSMRSASLGICTLSRALSIR